MTRKRALVASIRLPAFDRDYGSHEVDMAVRYLLENGWSVTFLAEDEAEDWHAERLRQQGVATYCGFDHAADVIAAGGFDLALLAFWKPATKLLPLIRRTSPDTRVLVFSIDLHFLREARRELGTEGRLGERFGRELVEEVNLYRAADGVLVISETEVAVLGALLGSDHVHLLPASERLDPSPFPIDERRGTLFVGNFRHLPNREAVELLCRDILPRLDPKLLERHPVTVVGNALDDTVRSYAGGLANVRMVGWVPSVVPYFERSRACIVPLLHGAGIKGKVIQSMMVGTPVVTTSIGAEGLDIVHDEHALVADSPADLAAALTRVLSDDDAWMRLAATGAAHVRGRHAPETVGPRLHAIVESVLSRPPLGLIGDDRFAHSRARAAAYRSVCTSTTTTIESVTDPGSTVLVASRGDDDLVRVAGRTGWHFPRTPDGAWAGQYPADGPAAVAEVVAMREAGADYLAFPSTAFWWLHHYTELADHLDRLARRVHADDDVVVFDLRSTAIAGATATTRPRVLVLGTYADDGDGPPGDLVRDIERDPLIDATQRWRRRHELDSGDAAGFDYVVHLDEAAVLGGPVLGRLVAAQRRVRADRAQAAHASGPGAAAPIAERLGGCDARVLPSPTMLPILSVAAGAADDGPTLLVDSCPIGLRPGAVTGDGGPDRVEDVYVIGDDGRSVPSVRRSAVGATPTISVLIATYDRPDLLERCLDGFCSQTIDADAYEVVVVDDGSPGSTTAEVLERYESRLPLVWCRISHAGRSAAKNLAVLLARGEIVVFFDDDDVPSPTMVAAHVDAHRGTDEHVAVLGHTTWAPELAVTPLMHYLTDVDKLLFAYGNLHQGQELDWRGFWEGRISCKRSLLVRHGLHDQRLAYSIDVELAWRLAPTGLKVVYDERIRSHMLRAISLDDFARRIEAKGRAQAQMALLHRGAKEIQQYAKVDTAPAVWRERGHALDDELRSVRGIERLVEDGDRSRLDDLHRGYRRLFETLYAKGVASVVDGIDAPVLTVTIPVWSRNDELADMAVRTIERVFDVARVPTEVVVVDNGSPVVREFRGARVHRFDTNRGVATAWNTGVSLARAPVVAILNSDCMVEPGWDEALLEAVGDGRRIAFPYTDHGDGEGFRIADQAGTAGWCFMLTTELFEEIGPFDERFNPAYGEDTDYWHRAWQLGIELTPVPAARVSHARRTTGKTDPHWEWLLQAHRYKYGWKHGVDPMAAPPYYNRPIVEFHGRIGIPAST